MGFSHHQKINSTLPIRIIEIEEPQRFININTASVLELESLPEIGPILARDIIFYRMKIGRYKDIEELKNIKGIGDKKLEKIKDLTTVGE